MKAQRGSDHASHHVLVKVGHLTRQVSHYMRMSIVVHSTVFDLVKRSVIVCYRHDFVASGASLQIVQQSTSQSIDQLMLGKSGRCGHKDSCDCDPECSEDTSGGIVGVLSALDIARGIESVDW
eukprot:202275-Amphidinium_carterae.1